MSAERPKVVLVGFLDTKLAEYDYVRRLLEERGCEAVMIDTSLKVCCSLFNSGLLTITVRSRRRTPHPHGSRIHQNKYVRLLVNLGTRSANYAV